ncbi:MAG: ankyrin repeat domain-containing protein [Lentisphaerae bacterium]|nr:ankyrin repeat domain-containing protein [Lentisphaerota bacterium]
MNDSEKPQIQDDLEIELTPATEVPAEVPVPAVADTPPADPAEEIEITLDTVVRPPENPAAAPAAAETPPVPEEKEIGIKEPVPETHESPENPAEAPEVAELPQPLFETPDIKRPHYKTGCFFFILFLLAIIAGGIYAYRYHLMEIRAAMVWVELKMHFRLFKTDLRELTKDEINDFDAKRRTEMHKTAEDGDLPRLKKLFAAGGDPEIQDDEKNTIFHYAAKSGNPAMIKFLHAKLPKLFRLTNANDDTILHIAAKYNHLPVVKYLLKNGLPPDALNLDGKTAYDLSSSAEVRKLLKKWATHKK